MKGEASAQELEIFHRRIMSAMIEELKELTFIPLQNAVFCANCELIANQTHDGACAACGSKALMSVSRLLGGTVMTESEIIACQPLHASGGAKEKHTMARFFHTPHLFSRNPSRN
jgi:hypothetical protein